MIEVLIENIVVWSVSCIGVVDSARTFTKLESQLPTLKGRKFYGCLLGDSVNGVYRACVAKIDSEYYDLESWTIPGGKYLKSKIKNWLGHEDLIGQTFSQMASLATPDSTRPYIEFYRSQKEIIIFFPIK